MGRAQIHQGGAKKRESSGHIKSEQRRFVIEKAGRRPLSKPHSSSRNDIVSTYPAPLVFQPQSEWYAAPLPALPQPADTIPPVQTQVLERVRGHAMSLLEIDNKHYLSSDHASSSSSRFYSTIMASGTLSDKVSALTLVVQESPVHNMKALESLLNLARKRNRGQAVDVLKALKDLLAQGAVLPPNRKLRSFIHQPCLASAFHLSSRRDWEPGHPLPGSLQDAHLVSWAYEDWLKNTYFELLKVLERWCNDEVEFARGRAVSYVWELLKDKPEQESNLLRLLVNKIGDPEKKIASKVSFLLLKLESIHPLMKPTVISAVESELLFRPGQSSHAKYYAIITLNQTVLSAKEGLVATKLLDIYFSLFVSLLKRPEETKTAFTGSIATKLNKKGQIQGGGGLAGKHSRRKIASRHRGNGLDDELREKMISAVLTGVNRAIPFTTIDPKTFEQHLDTLFRITHCSNFNTSIQALMLIQQLSLLHRTSIDRFYRTLYESLLDPRLLTSSKQAMFLNLLFRALKSDLSMRRVAAFIKRLLQVVGLHQPPFVCGVLYLVHELKKGSANLKALLDQPEEQDTEDEEVFQDAPDVDHETKGMRHSGEQANHLQDRNRQTKSPVYDGRKRDPEHSHAEKSCLWELTPFLAHFHPSVSMYASSLIGQDSLPNKPDLSLHTLIHFLDRFVYRNARSTAAGPRGMSIMQPLAGGDASYLLVSARYTSRGQAPVNSEAFLSLKSDDVAVDEAFFHDYFNRVGKAKPAVPRSSVVREDNERKGDQDEGSEDEIWKALVNSRPELEGDEESDNDLEMEDLESDSEDDSVVLDSKQRLGLQDDGVSQDGKDIGPELDLVSEDEAFFASDDNLPSDTDRTIGVRSASSERLQEADSRGKRQIKKRRKLKHLPTFASADEYAAVLNVDDE
ncbi:MAG: hypothetical protein M1830_008611 [Pleopsidium flavum]|nr:MAG: hypothetical protein M1830_008611 [Pleopsidium flavum]